MTETITINISVEIVPIICGMIFIVIIFLIELFDSKRK